MKIEKTYDEKVILNRMNQLRGVLATIVLLSHIWGYTGLIWLVPFNKVVTIAVSFFFFLSGYGMIQSVKNKKDYVKQIFTVKIPFLLWMAGLAYVFSAILEKLLISYGSETTTFLPFGIKQFLVSTNWYVYELIGFYIIFAFCARFVKEKYQLLVVGIVSIVAFYILFQSGLVEAYYNSIIGFWLGMLLGKYGCVKLMKQYQYGYIIGIVMLVFSFIMMFIIDRQTIIFAAIRNIAAVGAIIWVLYIVKNLDVDDVLMRYISKISPEIYFYHMPIALLVRPILKNSMVYVIVVIIASFAIAIPTNILNNKVQRLIKGANKNEA